MIVAMKKVIFLMKPQWANEAIGLLGEAGVLHVSHVVPPRSEDITEIENEIRSVEKAMALLEKMERGETEGHYAGEEAAGIVQKITDLDEEAGNLAGDLESLESDYGEAVIWGDFDPSAIREIEKAGIRVSLFSCSEEALQSLPPDLIRQVINHVDGKCYVAVFSKGKAPELPHRNIKIPDRSLRETERSIYEKKERLSLVTGELKSLVAALPLIKKYAEGLREKLEFESVRSGMGEAEGIAYVAGYVPVDGVARLRALSGKEGWGMVIEEPREDEEVPTLIKYSKLSILFQPVMSFIGITPGYFEYDTNAVFLIFFSLFFAMIAGDAGYGLILLVSALLLHRLKPSLSVQSVRLFYLLSLSTLVWGALTGNWFGAAGAGNLPLLKQMIIPGLDAFDAANSAVVMELCFFIAFLHLSVAHIWKGILSYPSLKALGEGGWVIMLAGIYLLVKGLILKSASLPVAFVLVLSGFVMTIIFGKQQGGRFLKGVAKGMKSLPVTALDGVGGLSNIVSYLRLFAVGMASKEVAAAFNKMALQAGFHDAVSILVAVMILIFGHGVNMLLIAMSVIVHGIRLNILEYSGHMNIEWSGIPYKPFGRFSKERSQD